MQGQSGKVTEFRGIDSFLVYYNEYVINVKTKWLVEVVFISLF